MTHVEDAVQEPVQWSLSNRAPRVLLVDAEEGIRAAVREMLEGRGFGVVVSPAAKPHSNSYKSSQGPSNSS